MKKITALLLTAISLSSCEFFKGTEVVKAPEQPEAIMIFLDGTQSYSYIDKAKHNTIKIIDSAPGGSSIMVRFITDKSGTPTNSILSCRKPIPPEQPQNEFDANESLTYEKLLAEYNDLTEKIYATIIDAPSPQANKTDIRGCLYSAKRLSSMPYSRKRLYLFTDMIDNARLTYPAFTLDDVEIYIFDFQDDPSSSTHDRKEVWKQNLLNKYSARSVEFKDVDEF